MMIVTDGGGCGDVRPLDRNCLKEFIEVLLCLPCDLMWAVSSIPEEDITMIFADIRFHEAIYSWRFIYSATHLFAHFLSIFSILDHSYDSKSWVDIFFANIQHFLFLPQPHCVSLNAVQIFIDWNTQLTYCHNDLRDAFIFRSCIQSKPTPHHFNRKITFSFSYCIKGSRLYRMVSFSSVWGEYDFNTSISITRHFCSSVVRCHSWLNEE